MKPVFTLIIGATLTIVANIANAEGVVRTDFQFAADYDLRQFEVQTDEVQVITNGETILADLDWTLNGVLDGDATLSAPGISFEDDCYYCRDARYTNGIYGMRQTLAWGDGSNNEDIQPGAPLVIDGVEHFGSLDLELVVQYERAGFGPDSLTLRGSGRFTSDAGDLVRIKIDDLPLEIVAVPEPSGGCLAITAVMAAASGFGRRRRS